MGLHLSIAFFFFRVTLRRKQASANDEIQKEMIELEEACKQDRKVG